MEQIKLLFTLLKAEQAVGENKLDVLKEYGSDCTITDFAILLGADTSDIPKSGEQEKTAAWWTITIEGNKIAYINKDGTVASFDANLRSNGIRPVIKYSEILPYVSKITNIKEGITEVEFGEYPQTIANKPVSNTLESSYQNNNLIKTGKKYTTDSVGFLEQKSFIERTFEEYEYDGKKYIRFVGDKNNEGLYLNDRNKIKKGEPYWIEVEPIKWLVDVEADIAISKKILVAGIEFNHEPKFSGNFNDTDIKQYLDKYFSKEIISSKTRTTSKLDDNLEQRIELIRKKIQELDERKKQLLKQLEQEEQNLENINRRNM